jgi:hypothetical protein
VAVRTAPKIIIDWSGKINAENLVRGYVSIQCRAGQGLKPAGRVFYTAP